MTEGPVPWPAWKEFAQINSSEIWSPNSTIISVFSVFFLCSPVVWPSAVLQRELLFRQARREGCAKFFCRSRKLTSPVSLMWQLLLSLNSQRGREHAQFLSWVQNNNCCLFTEGSSLSEVEMLNLLFSAQVRHGKRHTLPDQLCWFWDFWHLLWYIPTVVDPPVCHVVLISRTQNLEL